MRILTSSPISALDYTDSTVVAGETYYYVVTAVGENWRAERLLQPGNRHHPEHSPSPSDPARNDQRLYRWNHRSEWQCGAQWHPAAVDR